VHEQVFYKHRVPAQKIWKNNLNVSSNFSALHFRIPEILESHFIPELIPKEVS